MHRRALSTPCHILGSTEGFDLSVCIGNLPGGIDPRYGGEEFDGDSYQVGMATGVAFYLDARRRKLKSDFCPYVCTGNLRPDGSIGAVKHPELKVMAAAYREDIAGVLLSAEMLSTLRKD